MAKLTDIYQSKWLSAADLQNQEVVATISGVTTEEFETDGKKSLKLVCNFQGVEKSLILNKTNSFTIKEISGQDDTDHWLGTRVCLYPTMVQFGAKMTEAIRIKRPPAAPAVAPMVPAENQVMNLGATPTAGVEANPVDDIPFGNPLNAG